MFSRTKGVTGTAADALDGISPYANRLAHDEKLRQRLVAALGAGVAASERARRQAGLVGLGSDPVLRGQLTEAMSQLKKANGRLRRSKSHTTRNTLLLLTGAGALAAAVPSVRHGIVDRVRALARDHGVAGSSRLEHGLAVFGAPDRDRQFVAGEDR